MIDHATGATYGGAALVETWSVFVRSEGATLRNGLLATLGDSLALCRASMSFEAMRDGDLATFGRVERDELVLIETGNGGRRRDTSLRAADCPG